MADDIDGEFIPDLAGTDRILSQKNALREMTSLSRQFGRSITDAFSQATVHGKSFETVLQTLGTKLSDLALKAAFKPVENLLSQGFNSLTSNLSGSFGSLGGGTTTASAFGNVFSGGRVTPFAAGGVVAAPTYFPMGRDTGLMGEAGAEAVMPLARGPDGRLGVRAAGTPASASITVNITTPDVDGFRKSQTQVAASLARAVARGQRGL